MAPHYKRIIDYLRSKGIKVFILDTDSLVDEIIPLFLKVGINAILPFERQANNDLKELRKLYPDLIMMGGFDKNVLSKGKDEIDKELEISSWLISKGKYIPFCDHSIPSNSSWNNFKYYREKLNMIINRIKS